MRRDDFALTNAASGTTLNDGDAILAALREQHRWGVTAPELPHRYWRTPVCEWRYWSAAAEIARAKRCR